MNEKKIEKSINLNIIGTSNITVACKKLNIKLIYFSTSYVYPGTKGNYKETDPIEIVKKEMLKKKFANEKASSFNSIFIIIE